MGEGFGRGREGDLKLRGWRGLDKEKEEKTARRHRWRIWFIENIFTEVLLTMLCWTKCETMTKKERKHKATMHQRKQEVEENKRKDHFYGWVLQCLISHLSFSFVSEECTSVMSVSVTHKTELSLLFKKKKKKKKNQWFDPYGVVVGWLLNVPATCLCISGTDLLRQLYVLPHWDKSCRSNFLPHPVTVYWHWADQSQHWPYNIRRLAR